MRGAILIAAALLAGPAAADTLEDDARLLEVCLAEDGHSEAEPCRGLIADACTDGTLACLRREADAWDQVLRRHWPFRCGTCRGGFSLSSGMRLKFARERMDCAPGEEGDLRCLVEETARQATHVFGMGQ